MTGQRQHDVGKPLASEQEDQDGAGAQPATGQRRREADRQECDPGETDEVGQPAIGRGMTGERQAGQDGGEHGAPDALTIPGGHAGSVRAPVAATRWQAGRVPAKPSRAESPSDVDDLLPDPGLVDALQQRPAGIGSVQHAVRIALAVTVSWLVAEWVSRSALALFAPVTTLLVVQASPWSTLGMSVQRILGTGLGVLLASVYVNLAGLSWWSFLLGVLVALLVARLLPWSIGGQLQIPVAVVFVLAIGPGSVEQDVWRVLDVIIGGLVGLAAVFVFPSRPRPDALELALRRYRDALVAVVQRIGEESGREPQPIPDGLQHDYVHDSRRLRESAIAARAELDRLREATALNLRAGRVPTDLMGRALRLRRLSGIGVQVRALVGAANGLYDRADVEPTLAAGEFEVLVAQLVGLMRTVLGTGETEVGCGQRADAELLSDRLDEAVQSAAAIISGRRELVGEMLESVSVLGRIDHIRRQLDGFPRQED